MNINLSPIRSDDSLTVVKAGEVLTINGTAYDLSVIPVGATLPNPGDPFAGDIDRDAAGTLSLTLLCPHGADPSQAQAFPDTIVNPADGEIALPQPEVIEEEEILV